MLLIPFVLSVWRLSLISHISQWSIRTNPACSSPLTPSRVSTQFSRGTNMSGIFERKHCRRADAMVVLFFPCTSFLFVFPFLSLPCHFFFIPPILPSSSLLLFLLSFLPVPPSYHFSSADLFSMSSLLPLLISCIVFLILPIPSHSIIRSGCLIHGVSCPVGLIRARSLSISHSITFMCQYAKVTHNVKTVKLV